MKKSGALLASMAAASASAITSSSSSSCDPYENPKIQTHIKQTTSGEGGSRDGDLRRNSSSSEKFAPRFDGLRFIETLVTAHK